MGRILGRIALGVGAALVVLVAILLWNTSRYTPSDTIAQDRFDLGVDLDAAVQALSDAVTYETDSTQPGHPDFARFHTFLAQTYPAFHGVAERKEFTKGALMYRWDGSDPTLAPIMLSAHLDVVPVAPGSEERWDHPAFEGVVADGFVWGRGTLDDKGSLIAILEAAEHLAAQGFQPKRSVYLGVDGDEEVGGDGAAEITDHLIGQGVQLAWILDEGSFVLDEMIDGLDVPVASINLAEKGYLTLKLTAEAEGGHSSLPPSETAVGQLALAVHKVQTAPVPGGLSGLSAEFFDQLGRHFGFERRLLFANRWLFAPVLESILSGPASTNAMLRTTTAPTMLSGSPKENVLATEATAVINFRIHPRDTIDSVIAHVRSAIDDPSVKVEILGTSNEASPVAPSEAQGYLDIETSILQAFGPIATVPGLTIAATDARHYIRAADAAYRIAPFKITGEDLPRIHGTNERLSIENYEAGINFYGALLSKQ